MDLVNNINTVNLKKDQSPINDLEDLKAIIDWINDNGGKLPDKNSDILEEKNYGLKLNVILYRYIKYFNNPKELDSIKNKKVIEEILRLGSEIDLWNIKIDEATRQKKVKETENEEEKFLRGFLQVESSVSDFVNLEHEINELASPEDIFNKWYKLACEYYNEHDDLLVPFDYKTKAGENLGQWISNARRVYKNDKLSPDKIKKLEDIDMVWDADFKKPWEEWYQLAVEYRNEHGNLLVPRNYKTKSGENLGTWINTTRQAYKNGKLSPKQIEKLEAIGMVWDASINKEEIWNKWYQLAVEYRNEHGNLLVPNKYKTKSGENLGTWMNTTRQAYKNDKLSLDKIEKLEDIDMAWDASSKKPWEEWYKLAEEYRNEHGNLLVPTSYKTKSGENLGKWISDARQDYQNGNLSPHKIEKLEAIGMVWDASIDYEEKWNQWYQSAVEYRNEHGNLLVPASYKTKSGENLGQWISRMRQDYQKDKLSSDKIEKLEDIDMVWDADFKKPWEEWYQLAEEYRNEHGDLLVSSRYKTKSGENLGKWISDARQDYKNDKLSPHKIEKLEAIGMVWEASLKKPWEEWYKLAEEYYSEHGDLLVPASYKTKSGENIGRWISNIRQDYQNGNLSPDKIKKLDDIGMMWEASFKKPWEEWYKLAEEYYSEHGDLLVTASYKTKSGENIGRWISNIRQDYQNGNLSPDKIKKLEAIGMVWEASLKKPWEEWYKLAEEYYSEHGDLLVPINYQTKSEDNLGKWISNIRQDYQNGNLSPDKIKKLEDIGMVWDVREYEWNKMYKLAEEYRNEHGDLLVPINYQTKSGENLGKWISKARQDYKNGKLSPDKIKKLEAIGMVWDASIDYVEKWNKWYELAKEYCNEHGNLLVPKNYKTNSGESLGKWMNNTRQAYKNGKLLPEQIEELEAIGMVWDTKVNKKDIENYLEELKTGEPPIIIDKKLNKDILKHISLLELQSKIKFLNSNGISPIDSSGKLIDIFSMSSIDIEEKYGLSLETIINTYGKGVAKK